jgi:hypothetical protein
VQIKAFGDRLAGVLGGESDPSALDVTELKQELKAFLAFSQSPEVHLTSHEKVFTTAGVWPEIDIDAFVQAPERGRIKLPLLRALLLTRNPLRATHAQTGHKLEFALTESLGDTAVYEDTQGSSARIVKLADDARVGIASRGRAQLGTIATERDGIQPVERGIMELPLWEFEAKDGRPIFGVISDISDTKLANALGALPAPALLQSPDAAVEEIGTVREADLISDWGKRVSSLRLETPGLTARTLDGIAASSSAPGNNAKDAFTQDPAHAFLSDLQKEAVAALDAETATTEEVREQGGLFSTTLGPTPNPLYSEVKRLTVLRDGKPLVVVLNIPIVAWGSQALRGVPLHMDGRQYVVDVGGSDPCIRASPPNPLPATQFVPGGPPPMSASPGEMGDTQESRALDRDKEGALERYKGGQCLGYNTTDADVSFLSLWYRDDEKGRRRARSVNTEAGPLATHSVGPRSCLWKLHKGTFLNSAKASFYTVFAASRPPASGFMGVPVVPRQNHFGRGKDVTATGTVTVDGPAHAGGHWLRRECLLPVLTQRGLVEGADYHIEPEVVPDPEGGDQPVQNPNAGEVYFVSGQTIPRCSLASATLFQFANGLPRQDGGPNRFQPGVMPFVADSPAYTPLWHINYVFLNSQLATSNRLDVNATDATAKIVNNALRSVDDLLLRERNASAGASPGTASAQQRARGFDPGHPPSFDPVQVVSGAKGLHSEDFSRYLAAKHGAGLAGVLDSSVMNMAEAERAIFITEAPPGARQGWQRFLLVNCPIPVTFDLNKSNCEPFRRGYKDTSTPEATRTRKFFAVGGPERSDGDESPEGFQVCDDDALPSAAATLPDGYAIDSDSESVTQRDIFVAVTDASDSALASTFGATFAPALASAPASACELTARLNVDEVVPGRVSGLVLCEDPGLVSFVRADGVFVPPHPNPKYSPLKRLVVGVGHERKCVTLNCSTLSWKKAPTAVEEEARESAAVRLAEERRLGAIGGDEGEAEGGNEGGERAERSEALLAEELVAHKLVNAARQYVEDRGGSDARIRAIPPSPFVNTDNRVWPQAGPPGSNDAEGPLDRYKGGQALNFDLEAQTVEWKLHQATFTREIVPYYTVLEATTSPAAQFMGVVHAPKLTCLGVGTTGIASMDAVEINGRTEAAQVKGEVLSSGSAVATLYQFANGISQPGGGPNRFQPGIVPFDGVSPAYTPQWHVNFIFYNMTADTPVGGRAASNHDGTPEDDSIFLKSAHVQFSPPGSAIGGPSASHPNPAFRGLESSPVFQPFQTLGLTGAHNESWVRAETSGSSLGSGTLDLATMHKLIGEGKLTLTEAPPGAKLFGDKRLIVNCPIPFQFKREEKVVYPSGRVTNIPSRPPRKFQIGALLGLSTHWVDQLTGSQIPNLAVWEELIPGDELVVRLSNGDMHGIALSKTVSRIFEDDASGLLLTEPRDALVAASFSFSLSDAPGPLSGHTWVSTSGLGFSGASEESPTLLFRGKVRVGAEPGEIGVACSVHGPSAMSFRIRVR